MKRDIIKIDEELCNGCGKCIPGCHEGALQIIDGKAKLIGENMCDGLGACLGECPEGAISIEKREAEPFEEQHKEIVDTPCMAPLQNNASPKFFDQPTELRQWPIQLHLINPDAPFFKGSDLLIAADCTAFSIGNFHGKHLKDKSLIIACPKLDNGREIYLEKLIALIDRANLKTITVMMMEVPCCGGLLRMV